MSVRFLPLALTLALLLPTPAEGVAQSPEFYRDIVPILQENCLGCHTADGPAFSMEHPSEIYERRRMIAAMITERLMPPWIAAAGHQEYLGDPTLAPETLELVRRWREADFPRDESAAVARLEGHGSGHGHHLFVPHLGMEVLPSGSFLPNQSRPDDYRCFLVRWTEDEPRYITGFRAAPGNLQVAHHVVVHAILPEMVDRFLELEAAEDGDGYQCFGGAIPDRLGLRAARDAYQAQYPDGIRELSLGSFWLAHWAPGMDGHVFPEGTGIFMEPGSAVVVQMHYYGGAAPGESDFDTRVEFQVTDRVERPAFHLSQTRGEWLVGERTGSMVIPPHGMATYEVSDHLEALLPYISRVTRTPQDQIQGLEIHSANLHMHAIGHSGEISLVDRFGAYQTLLSVPRWDLRWQRDFTFAEPKIFPRNELRGAHLRVRCTFRNPNDHEVYGGYGSYDEMCFNFSYIAVQAGESATADGGGPAPEARD